MSVDAYFRNENTTDVWLTPPELVRALGDFVLDPCSPIDAPWRLAPLYYTEKHDGLVQPWMGRVFMNPPYGEATKFWMKKLSEHGDGIALVFARIETKWFEQYVWRKADAILFFNSRIQFYKPDGTKGGSASAPSCLVAYGDHNHSALHTSKIRGTIVDLKNGTVNV